jgi:hypothetical protein
MDERSNAEHVRRKFRACVIARRFTMPVPWSAPPRSQEDGRYALGSRHRAVRSMRPIGLGSERLYWSTRPPPRPRGWAGRMDRL